MNDRSPPAFVKSEANPRQRLNYSPRCQPARLNLHLFQNWRWQPQPAADEPSRKADEVQSIEKRCKDQEVAGDCVQLPREAEREGGFVLPRHRVLLRLHVPRTLSLCHHRRTRGRSWSDALLPRNCDCDLVWTRVHCSTLVSWLSVQISGLDWSTKLHEVSFLPH